MNILMNIIVLIFEVLYYSMFMYYAKKDGKFWKYILLFSLITILILILGSNNLISYIFFVLIALMGLKYFIKITSSIFINYTEKTNKNQEIKIIFMNKQLQFSNYFIKSWYLTIVGQDTNSVATAMF